MRLPIVISIGFLASLTLGTQIIPQFPMQLTQPTAIAAEKKLPNKNTKNLQPTTITLQRTACFGACPVYKLTIFVDGRVVYTGERYVKVTGKRTTRISPKAVKQLAAEFQKLNYFSLPESYAGGPTDMASAITSITIGKTRKSVNHYLGSPNAPQTLTALENKIDAVVNSQQWTGVKNQPTPNPNDSNSSQLETNRQLWNQQKLSHYRYTFRRSCFCAPKATEPAVIEVRNGKVVSITDAKSGKPVDSEIFQQYDSIPKLFDVIKDAIARNASSLTVKYDPKFGYPTQINIDYDQQMADEELYLTIEKLEAIN